MAVYDINGNIISGSGSTVTGKKAMPVSFNFAPVTEVIEGNGNLTATYKAISEPLGVLQYVGGVCANNKIYCCPNSADDILVYDTEKDFVYKIGSGLGTNQFKWTGCICWDGFVYCIARGVNSMLRIDPVTDEVKIINLGTKYKVNPYQNYMDSHHYCGAISDNGYLYSPPTYYSLPVSDKLLKINMYDFTWEELDFPRGCSGAVKHPTENKIIFLSSDGFILWNCDDDTYTDLADGTSRGCFDLVYDPRYNALIGAYSGHFVALKLDDYSFVDTSVSGITTGYGVTLGLDGKVYHLEGSKAYNVTFDGTSFTQGTTVTTSDNVGSTTPILAGQAIDNDGNIYGIPASGSMTKLSFDGVTRKLPDYIVSSQYYGKY